MSLSLALCLSKVSSKSIAGCSLARYKILRLMSPAVAARQASYWNHDWKPGPYPRTPEERERAAKRYGLLPEDYEPFPDDGNAPGDYPNLPAFSAHNRDQFSYFEHRQLTRHFAEPMHLQAELYRLGLYDPHSYEFPAYWRKLVKILVALFSFYGILWLGSHFAYHPAVMAKQFPYDKKGQKHYLFEPVDE